MIDREKALVRTFEFRGQVFSPVTRERHGLLLTTAEVAAGFGITPSTVRDHKKNHEADLVEGKHWCVENFDTSSSGRKKTYWTKQGIIRLADYINTDQAKQFKLKIEEQAVKNDELITTSMTPQQLLQFSTNLVLQARALVASQQELKEEVKQLGQTVEQTNDRATDAANLAREAQEEAVEALREINELKQQYLDELDRAELKKIVRDKMHELVELFMDLGESRGIAYGQVWAVMRKKYGFLEYKDMHWLHYNPAVKFLQETIDLVKQQRRVPLMFLKDYRDRLVKPEPRPVGAVD